jgi:hypothetical protein
LFLRERKDSSFSEEKEAKRLLFLVRVSIEVPPFTCGRDAIDD